MAILSIDFDTIMEPSIRFYNEMIGTKDPLSKLLERAPMVEQSLQADLYKYQYLTRLLMHYIKMNIPIYFIESHEDLFTIVKRQNLKKEAPCVYDIINIDHHHDIAYDIDNEKQSVSLECGSWVKYGMDKKLFSSYTWIKNPNSSDPEKFLNKYLTNSMLFSDFANKPFPKDIEEVFVCASWEWIPPMYRPLFNTWMSIYEESSGKDIKFEKI